MIVQTPSPPYYAVIFSSVRTEVSDDYIETDDHLMNIAKDIDGFYGMESARNELGIAVSYWRDLEAIDQWRHNADHGRAKVRAREEWYAAYKIRICKVEEDRGFVK
ncbi:MAG: antibiotic biosynthesis monooxygenase [Flavobacteriales bacterium]|nr:antibiotic biosynthesis monooxygenase [Flavobacteriales bacterium]